MKNKYNHGILVMLTLVTLVISSCGKYEEGPALSLRSKKARVANDWKFNKIVYNGEDVSSFFLIEPVYVSFDKDGKFEWSSDGDTETGTWKFSDDKEELLLTYSSSDTEIWEIVKLKNDDLWFKMKDGDDVIEAQLVSK